MKPPRRYLTPAEMADAARARRNLAAAQLVAMAAAIAAGALAIIHFAHPGNAASQSRLTPSPMTSHDTETPPAVDFSPSPATYPAATTFPRTPPASLCAKH
jgi:hypothetical protein